MKRMSSVLGVLGTLVLGAGPSCALRHNLDVSDAASNRDSMSGGSGGAGVDARADVPSQPTPTDGGGVGACPVLDQPANGLVTAPTLTVGSVATYSCNLGAQLMGTPTRTCQSTASWSGSAATCAFKDCGPLAAPAQGSVAVPQTTYGAVATYSCGVGFGPSGSATRTCQVDGTWSGSQPTCVVANCPALPGPAGGTVVATSLIYGAVADYACSSGYTMNGAPTRTCQPDGSWSGSAPSCTINDCGALKAPSNGTVSMTKSSYGATASFACASGYLLSGSVTVTCQTDSTWSAAPPTCVIKDCGPLTAPPNGAVDDTSTTFGSTAAYSCATGYGLAGGATRTCAAAGTWSGTAPTCSIKDCGALVAPANGSVTAAVTTYGAMATYACATGYGPSGSATRTCTAAGTWDGTAPTCVISNCPALTGPVGGSVSAPTLTFGSTATYACGTGYDLTGTATRICQPSGAWSGAAPTCTIKNCGAVTAPTNGTVSAPVTTFGSTATYACSAGYSASGPLTRGCQGDGTWSGTAPTCAIKNCGPLTGPTNGAVTAPTTTFGSTANYACNAGYTAAGAVARTCQADGTWSGTAPTCQINDCGSLTPPMNGAVSAPVTTFGAVATYSCVLGFGPSGSATRTCQANGTWSGTAPTCVIANCPALVGPTGGSVSAPALTFGSTATYTCDAGFTLSGSATRQCQANSLWTGTQPTCSPKDCGAPPTPTHGSVVAASTVFKASATYACDSGYILSGALTRTCQSDQTWSGAVPTCTPVDCGVPPPITNGSPSFLATVFGSSAVYACAANFTIASGASATVTCLASGAWSTPRPTCVDICTVAGNVGTSNHCCSSAACSASLPICSGTPGVCTQCPTGPCSVPNAPCKVGIFSCTTGNAVCVANGDASDGQVCSAGECSAGQCLPCGGDQQMCCKSKRACAAGNTCLVTATGTGVLGCIDPDCQLGFINVPSGTCGRCGRPFFACCDGSEFTTLGGGSPLHGSCDGDPAGTSCDDLPTVGFSCTF